jgi:hypothetical protein
MVCEIMRLERRKKKGKIHNCIVEKRQRRLFFNKKYMRFFSFFMK